MRMPLRSLSSRSPEMPSRPLFAHLVGHILYELAFVHLIRQLGDDYAYAVVAVLLHLRTGAGL